MAQSKGKKTTTINIDKINGIENENEIDGFIITDEIRAKFSGANLGLLEKVASIGITKALEGITSPMQGIGTRLSSMVAESGLSKAHTTLQSVIAQLNIGLGAWLTPEVKESMRLFSEYVKAKQAIEIDRYNNTTHVAMKEKYTLDYPLLTEKEKKDFFLFVIFSFKEDERWELSFGDFLISITDREWQDRGMKYYALQKKESFDSLIEFEKQLSTPPAPNEIGQGNKKKAGRPESKNVAERNQLIHNDYLKLKIDGTTNVKGTLLVIHKNTFNHPNHETNRKNLDRIIQKMEQKTKDIN